MNNQTFYFCNNGQVYKFDKPTLDIPISDLPSGWTQGDAPREIVNPPAAVVRSLRLQSVAMSYFDEDAQWRVFVLNTPSRPEIIFSGDFPFNVATEERLIGLIADIVHPT